jgi:hypothetical protein
VGLLPPPKGDRRSLVFFLSHRGPDTKERLVRPVHWLLQRLGVPHFFDQDPREGIRLMKRNDEEMSSALYGAQVVVLFLSSGFCESKWCVWEANAALRRELEEGREVVLPVYDSQQVFMHPQFKCLHRKSSIIRGEGMSDRELVLQVVVNLLQLPFVGEHPRWTRDELEQLLDESVQCAAAAPAQAASQAPALPAAASPSPSAPAGTSSLSLPSSTNLPSLPPPLHPLAAVLLWLCMACAAASLTLTQPTTPAGWWVGNTHNPQQQRHSRRHSSNSSRRRHRKCSVQCESGQWRRCSAGCRLSSVSLRRR